MLLKRSGLYAVEAGSDAASNETLAGLNKHLTFDDIYEFNKVCVDVQIPCAHYVMFGGPGETEKTLQEGFRNLKTLKNCVIFAFSGIRIFPGATLQTQAIKDGILKEGESLLKPVYYFSPAINPAQMNQFIANEFRGPQGQNISSFSGSGDGPRHEQVWLLRSCMGQAYQLPLMNRKEHREARNR